MQRRIIQTEKIRSPGATSHSSSATPRKTPKRLHTVSVPYRSNSLIGSSRELCAVRRLLANSRIVTLTGTGGSGKTRLAIEVLHHLAGRFDEVAFIAFDSIADPALVPPV